MNLHQIVRGAIRSVNPDQLVDLRVSTGYTMDDEGRQVPLYADPVTVVAQLQDLTGKDLKQLESLNIQGSTRAVYFSGSVQGIVRLNRQGGDLITLHLDNTVWLTTQVLESWDVGWCKVACTLQMDSAG